MAASDGHYRHFFHRPAWFVLKHARYGWSVGAGIAGAVVSLGLFGSVLWLRPDIAQREVDPLSLLLVIGTIAAFVAGAVRLVRGPRLALKFEGESLSLMTTANKELARCSVEELSLETLRCSLSGFEHPAVRLALPDHGRRLVVGVNWPAQQLPWRDDPLPGGEATHLVEVPLWLPLVRRLGLEAELGPAPQPVQEAEPPAELRVPPAWRRYLKLAPYGAPLLIVVALAAWPERELAPQCLAAARCCLARVNAQPPVTEKQLRACTSVALSEADRCGSLRARAEQDALAAGSRCDESVVKRYASYDWAKPATEVPGATEPKPPDQRYPRVSCRDAAMKLVDAVDQQAAGDLLVVRPKHLMTQAVSLGDPNAFVYCDGYPLPVAKAKMGSAEAPVVEGPGPHAVLLRPRSDGRFDLLQYCLGCNRVGKEARRQ